MAMHHHLHHLHKVHHHVRRAGKSFLVKAAEHHPILVSVLALVGGVAAVKAFTNKNSTTATVTSPTQVAASSASL